MNGDFVDASGNNYDATSQNGLTPVNDRHGNSGHAMYFDGIDDIVNLPNIAAMKPNLPVTFSFWVKTESLDIADNYWFHTEETYNYWTGFKSHTSADNVGKISVSYSDGGTQTTSSRRTKVSATTLTVNTWQHIVLVVKSEIDIDIYIDCNDAGGTYSGTGSTAVAYNNNAGNFGYTSGNSTNSPDYFNGTMDDFAFWDRELSISEIVDVCNDGLWTGINENISFVEVNGHPNPTTGNFEFSFSKNHKEISINIFNSLGQKVCNTLDNNSDKVVVDMSEMVQGIYFAKVNADGVVRELKIIKE